MTSCAVEIRVEVVVAVASNGTIGAGGGIPWRLPADLTRFRKITTGHSVVMGRRTWDSLGRILPHRENIVVTSRDDRLPEGVLRARSLSAALQLAGYPQPVFVLGGERLYKEALSIASVLHVTEIHRPFAGDVFFPPIDPSEWSEASREAGEGGDHDFTFDFVTYRRRNLQRERDSHDTTE